VTFTKNEYPTAHHTNTKAASSPSTKYILKIQPQIDYQDWFHITGKNMKPENESHPEPFDKLKTKPVEG
jgi:hypothetical protein